MPDQSAGAIDAWMSELRAALRGRRRVRATRIADEAYEHLRDASGELETQGMPRADAELAAVARVGSAAEYAAGFRGPTVADWSIRHGTLVAAALRAGAHRPRISLCTD